MIKLRALTAISLLAASLGTPATLQAANEAVRQSFVEDKNTPPSERSVKATGKYLPWYAIPSKFLFTGSYYTHLNIKALRIDHVAENSRCTPKNRIFMISAALEQPIGTNLFSSRLEVPFFSADRLQMSRLRPASVGDYVLFMSNEQMARPSLQLAISARF